MKQIHTKKRVGKIELLRFLFCILILLYHIGKDYKGRHWMFTSNLTFFNKGFIGVEFFFLVTGFVTAAAIFSQRQKAPVLSSQTLGEQTWKFMWKKIKAILPFHIIIIIATLIFRVAFLNKNCFDVIARGMPNIFFVQMNGYGNQSLIGVEWYISSMLIALIIIYPLCLKFYDTFTHIIAPFIGIVFSGIMILNNGSFGADGKFNLFTTNGNIRAIAHISIGIFLFELVQILKTKDFSRLTRIILTILEPLCYIAVVYMAMCKDYSRQWLGSMFLFMIIGVTISFSGIAYGQGLFNNKLVYFLGKASLPIYLVQNLIRDIGKKYIFHESASTVIVFTVGITLASGLILQLIVDNVRKKTAVQ